MFESFISLDCHVCPDVVQTLNQIALLNPRISHEMIDGGLHPAWSMRERFRVYRQYSQQEALFKWTN